MKILTIGQSIGIESTYAEDLDDALSLATLYEYDAAVISDALSTDLLTATRRLRFTAPKLPILCSLGAVSSPIREQFYNAGADMLICGDCLLSELNSALTALVRRSSGAGMNLITVGNVAFNLLTKDLFVNGVRTHITNKQSDLLSALFSRYGKVVSKDTLMCDLYGFDGPDNPKILDVFVCHIRNALAAQGADDIIETVWGRGYRITENPMPCKLRSGSGMDALLLLHAKGTLYTNEITKALPHIMQDTLRLSFKRNSNLVSSEWVPKMRQSRHTLTEAGKQRAEEILKQREDTQ